MISIMVLLAKSRNIPGAHESAGGGKRKAPPRGREGLALPAPAVVPSGCLQPMETMMVDFSYQQIAATLASGIMAADSYNLRPIPPAQQAGIAVNIYRECLKQLREYPEGEGPTVARV